MTLAVFKKRVWVPTLFLSGSSGRGGWRGGGVCVRVCVGVGVCGG